MQPSAPELFASRYKILILLKELRDSLIRPLHKGEGSTPSTRRLSAATQKVNPLGPPKAFGPLPAVVNPVKTNMVKPPGAGRRSFPAGFRAIPRLRSREP